ncbi:MAG: hypothetical protein Q8N89_12995 [Azonexus sp.]|nr:hypothetical protein [Azonexus sp.]
MVLRKSGYFLLLALSSHVYGEGLTLAKCSDIKNSTQRLACYDRYVPEVVKQQSDAKSSLVSKKNEEAEAAINEQKKLVKDTLRELRKLGTATEVGVSKVEYSRRVIDSASVIALNITDISDARVQQKIKDSITAFTDANEYWELMIRHEYVKSFFDRYGDSLAKYGVYLSAYSYTRGTFRDWGMTQVLSPIWATAKNSIAEAESLANGSSQQQ